MPSDLTITAAAPWQPAAFDTGSERAPGGWLPGAAVFSDQEALHALNPLQHLPLVGMIYRQAGGETLPAPLSIMGSMASGALFGGPLGVLGSVMLNLATELVRLGPDTSRPPVPEGMDVTGSEAGIRPVSPGSITTPGGYTTLATVVPDFLGGVPPAADGTLVRQAIAAYEAGTLVGHG